MYVLHLPVLAMLAHFGGDARRSFMDRPAAYLGALYLASVGIRSGAPAPPVKGRPARDTGRETTIRGRATHKFEFARKSPSDG